MDININEINVLTATINVIATIFYQYLVTDIATCICCLTLMVAVFYCVKAFKYFVKKTFKKSLTNTCGGMFIIDLKQLDIDFYKYITRSNHSDLATYTEFRSSSHVMKQLSLAGYSQFVFVDTRVIGGTMGSDDSRITLYYLYCPTTDRLIISDEKMYKDIYTYIDKKSKEVNRICYLSKSGAQIGTVNSRDSKRHITDLYHLIQKNLPLDKMIDLAFKPFYHSDKESIVALVKSKIAVDMGGILFLEGVSGAGKTEFCKIMMRIYHNAYTAGIRFILNSMCVFLCLLNKLKTTM